VVVGAVAAAAAGGCGAPATRGTFEVTLSRPSAHGDGPVGGVVVLANSAVSFRIDVPRDGRATLEDLHPGIYDVAMATTRSGEPCTVPPARISIHVDGTTSVDITCR
jgi:hypothetical protein